MRWHGIYEGAQYPDRLDPANYGTREHPAYVAAHLIADAVVNADPIDATVRGAFEKIDRALVATVDVEGALRNVHRGANEQ